MKVLLLNGSPHEKGCVYTALSEVEKTLKSAGLDTEIFWIGNKPVADCIACGKCHEQKECCFQDEIYTAFVQKMRESDALIVGTPVYYAGPSGSLCSLLDRAFASAGEVFIHKPAACIVNCRRGGAGSAFDRLNKYFTISQMPIVSSQYWNDTHGTVPEDVKQDAEGLQTMRILGNNMAHLLKSLKQGAIPMPEQESRICTNFIQRQDEPKDKEKANGKISKRMTDFFQQNGYLIHSCNNEPNDDEHSLAKQLAKCDHQIFRPFLRRLYESKESNFEFSLKDLNTENKNRIMNLCKSLKEKKWIDYSAKKDSVQITQIDAKKHRSFYGGHWAELVNRYLILSVFGQNPKISHCVFHNVKLRKIESNNPNQDMELDIVVDLKDRFYIFETKSGEVLGIDKWIDRARLFGGDKNRFILCCDDDNANPKHFAPYPLFSLSKLKQQLTDLLKKDFPPDDTEVNKSKKE